MVIFHSYVAVYQRVTIKNVDKHNLTIKAVEQKPIAMLGLLETAISGQSGNYGLAWGGKLKISKYTATWVPSGKPT